MTVTRFRLFEDGDYDEYGANLTTLADFLARLPDDVPHNQIHLTYAGCGSHDVDVAWGEPDPVEPEPDPPPAPRHPADADPPLPRPEAIMKPGPE